MVIVNSKVPTKTKLSVVGLEPMPLFELEEMLKNNDFLQKKTSTPKCVKLKYVITMTYFTLNHSR